MLGGLPNGVRYPLVGGTRQRHFNGTHFKPRKVPENAPTPTSRVHAVLGAVPDFRSYLTLEHSSLQSFYRVQKGVCSPSMPE